MRILEIIINIYIKNELLLKKKKTKNMKKVISFNFFHFIHEMEAYLP